MGARDLVNARGVVVTRMAGERNMRLTTATSSTLNLVPESHHSTRNCFSPRSLPLQLWTPYSRCCANLNHQPKPPWGCSVSSEETRRIAELLSNEGHAVQLLRGAVHQEFWSSQPGPSCVFRLGKLIGETGKIYSGSVLATAFDTMFRRLYQYAESPIERTLFGALCIRLAHGTNPYEVIVHKPTSDLEKYIHDLMAYMDDFTSAYASDAFVRGEELPDEDDIWVGGAFRWGDPSLNDIIREADKEYIDFVNAVHLVPQSVLNLSGKAIRPDLAIWFPTDEGVRLLIECDGYQFHSGRDKFKSDRIRDRELLELGYKVLRYSGSEIMEDPFELANTVLNLLRTLSIPVRPNLYRRAVSQLTLLRSHSTGLAGLPEDFREIAELSRAVAGNSDGFSRMQWVAEVGEGTQGQSSEAARPQLVLALQRLDDDRLRELLGAVLFGRDYDQAHGSAPMRFLESIRQARCHSRDFCTLNLMRRPIDQYLDRAAHHLSRSAVGSS